MTPGAYLRMRRQAAGLSYVDVGRLLGAERLSSPIELIEVDARRPSADDISRLHRLFNFDGEVLARLLAGDDSDRICSGCGCTEWDPCGSSPPTAASGRRRQMSGERIIWTGDNGATLSQEQVLEAVWEHGRSGRMTYVLRNILAEGRPGLTTPPILRALRRLEKAGKVQRVGSPYAVQLCWAPVEEQVDLEDYLARAAE